MVESSPPHRIRLQGTGEGITIGSGVVLDMEMELTPLDEGATRAAYVSDAEISGRLAMVGEAVLKIKAREVQRVLEREVRAALEGGAD